LNSLTQGNAENFEFRTTHCPCPLQRREEEFERHSVAAPSASWSEAAVKARYLIGLFAATLEARNQRRQELIAQVLGRAGEGGSDGATFPQIA
jgi:hypothetical protein